MSYDPQQPGRPVNYVPGGYIPTPPPSFAPATYGQPPQPPAPGKSRAIPILSGVLVVAVIAVGGLIAFYLLHSPSTAPARSASASAKIVSGAAFQAIDENCRTSMPSYDVEDGGHTLILTVGGSDGMDTDTMTCVFNSLNIPDAVRQHIGTTRALDGQQTDSWDDYTARWTYFPDDGLQMTIRKP